MPDPARLIRPALRPGLRVVRRDDRHLQVGIDPPHRLVVEDDPDVRRVLGDLRTGAGPAPTTPAGHRALTRLLDAGLLVEATELDEALAGADDRAGALAVFAQFGDRAADRVRARRDARVVLDAPADLAHPAARLLRAAGLSTAGVGEAGSVALLIADAEPARDRLDAAVRAGRPHLLVTGSGQGVRVGPFVVPGLTACVRCVDAHLGEVDPRRATVLEQCTRGAGDPEPRDPALMALAVAWAVRDVVSLVDGDRPATWSTTVELRPGLALDRHTWTRHPHCGCAWDQELVG
ncbi:MAG: hypothetical protein JWO76_718 [Nocardioides sp.]|nr:hypothetical protein [Nocardioides sp.]